MKWASLKRNGKKETPRKLRTAAASSTKIHHQSTKLDSSPKRPPNAFTTSATPQPRSRSRSSSSTAARNKNGARLNDVAQEAIADAASLERQVKEGNSSNSNNAGSSTNSPSLPRTLSMAPQLQLKGGNPPNPNNTGTSHPWDNMVKEAISAAEATAGANRFEADPDVVQRRRSAVEFKQSGSARPVASPGRGSRDNIRRNSNPAPESNLRPSKYTNTNGNYNKATHDDGDDDASWTSHGSHTSYSTSFSVTYNKLKGMMRSRSLSRNPKAGPSLKNHNRKPQRSSSEKPLDHASGKMTQKHRRSNKPATATAQGIHISSSHSSTTTSNSVSISPISQRGGNSNEVNHYLSTTTTISLNDVKKVEEQEHSNAEDPTPHSSAYNSVTADECSETLPPSLVEPIVTRHQAPADYASAYGVATSDSSSTGKSRRGDYPSSVGGSLMDKSTTSACASAFLSAAVSEYSDMDPASVCRSVNNSNGISVITNSPAEYLIINPTDGSSTVLDLPWVGNSLSRKLRGVYSGPVAIVPHGEGKLVLADGGTSLAFIGRWENGQLVTPLRNDDEGGSATLAESVKHVRGGSIGNPTHEDNHKKKKKSSSRKNPNTKAYYANLAKEVEQTSLPKSTSTISQDTPSHDNSSARSKSLQPPTKPKYALGAIARSPRDMIIHRSNEEAVHSASLLKKYDQAFLRRSNGVWTCAVLADRTSQPTNAPSTRAHWHTQAEIDAESMNLEECMLFVINEEGATKIVKKRHWGKFVRRHLAAEGEEDNGTSQRTL